MGIALLALATLALAWTLLALRWRVAREPDAWVDIVAEDGHPLGLGHYRARGERRAAEPVILCHGVSANRFNMDMDDETSLARHLAARGFDAYVLELRGRGRSVRRGLAGLVPRQRFDDYPALDVPAAIEVVRARHGAERVHWVGHSMGGLALYAYLGGEAAVETPRVRSAVTIGSPVQVDLPAWLRLGVRAAAWWPLPLCPSRVSFLIAPVVGWFAHPPLGLLLNPRNVRGRRLRHAVANVVADVSVGEVAHFAGMSRGTFRSADGARDYAADLARATCPVLAIAGTVDRLATPAAVRAGYLALGGAAPHAYRLAGRASGDPIDFGHGDLVIGDHAPAVVFPAITGWLEAHDPALAESPALALAS